VLLHTLDSKLFTVPRDSEFSHKTGSLKSVKILVTNKNPYYIAAAGKSYLASSKIFDTEWHV